jgi:hypothetical protein
MHVVTKDYQRAWRMRCQHAARRGRPRMKRHAHKAHRAAARATLRGDWWDGRERMPRRLTGWEVA